MTCGCCLEACPRSTTDNDFIGAAAISQARLFNMHPTGKLNAEERMRGADGRGRHPGLRQGAELRRRSARRRSRSPRPSRR